MDLKLLRTNDMKKTIKPYLTRFDVQMFSQDAADRIDKLLRERKMHYEVKETVFICLLRGGLYYFADLTRELAQRHNVDIQLEFLRVHSYVGNGQSGELVIEGGKDILKQFAGKDVWLVDDIIDTGNTMISLVNEFHKLPPEDQPTGIFVTALLMRRKFAQSEDMDRLVKAPINALVIPGMVEDNAWLVGYGMEDEGKYRNLEGIYKLEDDTTPGLKSKLI